MGVRLLKITLPTTEWEDSVLAHREKQKRQWERKQKTQQTGKKSRG